MYEIVFLTAADTAAREDNPEDVVAAGQRALGEEGLTAGRFYTIYNPEAAVPIEDPGLRKRYESKRDHDLNDLHDRIQRVGVERAYRITGSLEKLARHIEEKAIPRLSDYKSRWRKLVLGGDAIVLAVLLLLALPVTRPVATSMLFLAIALLEAGDDLVLVGSHAEVDAAFGLLERPAEERLEPS